MNHLQRRDRLLDSNGRGPAGDAMTSPTYICCGQRPKRIDIRSGDSTLSLSYCGGCESMRWFKDGLPTDDDSLLGALQTTGLEPRVRHA